MQKYVLNFKLPNLSGKICVIRVICKRLVHVFEIAKYSLRKLTSLADSLTSRNRGSVRDSIFCEKHRGQYLTSSHPNGCLASGINASAESLNSKIKCFRAQVKGVKDIPFFMYRLETVLD
jgi:hypothetical protein